jgi:hypothetical protein
MRDGRQTCYRCDWEYGACADRMGSVIYGIDGEQSERLMYGYKSAAPGPSHVKTVTALITVALRAHTQCASAMVGVRASRWVTVPSLRKHGTKHPLRVILTRVLGTGNEIAVSASANIRDPRDLNPANYELRAEVPKGAHVMVIDDTYTSGGRIGRAGQSLFTASGVSGMPQPPPRAAARPPRRGPTAAGPAPG